MTTSLLFGTIAAPLEKNDVTATELARLLAPHFPDWTLVVERLDYVPHVAYLERPDGARLAMRVESSGAEKGRRAEIYGIFPCLPGTSCQRYTPAQAEARRIGVSVTRPPEAIAREIERRLLPVYLPAYARAVCYCVKRDELDAAGVEAARRVAFALGEGERAPTELRGGSARLIAYKMIPGVERVSAHAEIWAPEEYGASARVDVKLHDLTVEQLEAVALALRPGAVVLFSEEKAAE